MDARRTGMRWGIAATILGIVGLAAVLYAPIHPATINGTPGYYTSWWNPLADPRPLLSAPPVGVPLALGVAVLLLIGVGAAMQAQAGSSARPVGQVVLWAATVGLLLLMLFATALPFFQIFLLPALAAALVASVFSLRAGSGRGFVPQ